MSRTKRRVARRILLAVTIGWVVASDARAAAGRDAWSDWIAPLVESRDLAGAIRMVRGDEDVLRAAYGLADLDADEANRPSSRFAIGSLTKQLTAATVLALWERGAIDLQQPIGRYLPGASHGDAITVHHLLAHQSGLPRDVPPVRAGASSAELVTAITAGELAFAPGSRVAYSNAGYRVLAALVEAVTGERFEDVVRARVLEPAGLRATGFWDGATPLAGQARGYEPGVGRRGLRATPTHEARRNLGADGMVSTVDDLVRWATVLRDRSLLSPAAHDALVADHGDGRGYGVASYRRGGRRVIGHDGVTHGYTAFLEWYPDDDLIVAYAGNVRTSAYEYLEDALPRLALGEALPAVDLPAAVPPARPLHDLVGRYQVYPGLVVEIAHFGDHLELRGTGGYFTPLMPTGDDRLWYRSMHSLLSVTRDDGGRVTGLSWRDVHQRTFPLPRLDEAR